MPRGPKAVWYNYVMMMSDLFDTEEFEGHHSVADLRQNRCAPIPPVRGVYVERAPDGFKPIFLETSRGGHFKGIDPTMPIGDLIFPRSLKPCEPCRAPT